MVAKFKNKSKGIGYAGEFSYITDPRMVGLVFAIPIALVLFVNLALFIVVVVKVSRLPTVKSEVKRQRNTLAIYAKLSTITGATWIFGFLHSFTQVVALEYIHTILNATQGVFLFVSFVCNKRVLCMYIKKLSSLRVKATFSEALSRRQKHITVNANTF